MKKRKFETNRDIVKCSHCNKWISVICPIGEPGPTFLLCPFCNKNLFNPEDKN